MGVEVGGGEVCLFKVGCVEWGVIGVGEAQADGRRWLSLIMGSCKPIILCGR